MRFTCASSSSSCVTRWPRHRHTSGCNTFSNFSSLSVHSRCRRPHVYLAGWSHSQAEPQRRSTFRPRITLFVENGDTMNTLVGKDVIDHDLSSARCGTARGVLTCSSNSSTTLLWSAPMNYHKERPTLEGQPAQVAATGLSSGQRRALMETFADKGTHRRKLFDERCDFLREFWTTGPIWRAST